MSNKTPPISDYLDARSIPEPNTGCFLWTGPLTSSGYGKATHKGRTWVAHRLAWLGAHGCCPDDLFVCHKCDTRCCVNPAHLFLGTPADNSADMTRKGRSTRGTKNGRAKLDADKVRAIRASTERHRDIAAGFGISRAMVSFVRARKNWQHVA